MAETTDRSGARPRSRASSSVASYEVTPPAAPTARDRRRAHYGAGSTYDDDGEDARSTRSLPDKKQNHSEIEKRRRDKMNTYISELAAMVPMCGAMARKLDKLTVLRMAVQHLRGVRGTLATGPLTACPRPPYVTERELNGLVLAAGRRAALMVVGCDRGRLLFVSRSVHTMLQYTSLELLGQSLFDILHPKDVAKVKEQLSSWELGPRERLVDAKTMLPLRTGAGAAASRLCPGARRSFFCRIKCKSGAAGGEPAEAGEPAAKLRKKSGERRYCAVQCTGYLKAWAAADEGSGSGDDEAGPGCLVALVRALPDLPPPRPPARPLAFLSRHATDGKYLFVDQRVTLALGWLPQELLGTSLYEHVASGELAAVARAHRAALVRRAPQRTPAYAARRKDGSTALLQTHFKPFQNPWTKDVECLVAQHTLLPEATPAPYDHRGAEGGEAGDGGAYDEEVQRLIDSQMESHKIGSAIAEEALRRSPASCTLDLPPELLHDALFSSTELGGEGGSGLGLGGSGSPPGSPSLALDGNGEAAMAVIMSLLEADAGLGGPVNFSGLPWPLP